MFVQFQEPQKLGQNRLLSSFKPTIYQNFNFLKKVIFKKKGLNSKAIQRIPNHRIQFASKKRKTTPPGPFPPHHSPSSGLFGFQRLGGFLQLLLQRSQLLGDTPPRGRVLLAKPKRRGFWAPWLACLMMVFEILVVFHLFTDHLGCLSCFLRTSGD